MVVTPVEPVDGIRVILQGINSRDDGAHTLLVPHEPLRQGCRLW